MRLYHYTCPDAWDRIKTTMTLQPGPLGLVWLTDLEVPDQLGLGLTSFYHECDRMAVRLTVETDAERWTTARRRYPTLQPLETTPGAMPGNWYVSPEPALVVGRQIRR